MKRGKWLFAVLMVFVIVFVSACANDADTNSENSGNNGNTGNNTGSPSEPGNDDGSIDPLGKYDPPITVTMAIPRSTASFTAGESDGDNRWTDEYLTALGIEVDAIWAVPEGSQYNERVGVTIATGDLPDVMRVDKITLGQLVESDLVEDMTEVYEKYASPLLKSILDLDGNGYAQRQATFNGRMMAVTDRSASLGGKMILIRKDWLDNLELEVPATMQELLEVARAFTHDDPDLNGLNDTFGLAANAELTAWNLDLSGFFHGYGGYTKMWVQGEDGKLVYGSTLPEVREALLQLQAMYKDGQLDQEFAVKNINRVGEDVAAGRFGMIFGSTSAPIMPFRDVKELEPDMELISIPLVSITGEPAKPGGTAVVDNFYVVRKGFEHPEALVKMQNLFADIWFGEQSHRYEEMITGEYNGEQKDFFQFAPVKATNQGKNIVIHQRIVEALDGQLPLDELNTEERTYYDLITAYENGTGDASGWAYRSVFGKESTFGIQVYYRENAMHQVDEFYGLPTETMKTRWSTLQSMEDEVFPKIIMGDSIDTFDKFVNDWHNLGGTEITAEVNEWFEANN